MKIQLNGEDIEILDTHVEQIDGKKVLVLDTPSIQEGESKDLEVEGLGQIRLVGIDKETYEWLHGKKPARRSNLKRAVESNKTLDRVVDIANQLERKGETEIVSLIDKTVIRYK